jgi:hypothetical protein
VTTTLEASDQPRRPGSATPGTLDAAEEALQVRGDLATARAAFREAFDQAQRDRDPQRMARAALGLGGLWVQERRSAADAASVESRQRLALSCLDPGSAMALRLRIRLAAEADYRCGRGARVTRLLAEARARGDEPLALAEALNLAQHCLLGPVHSSTRIEMADELLRVAASTHRPVDTVLGLLWRAAGLFLSGSREAERAYADLLSHAAVNGNLAASAVAQAMRAMLRIRAGELRDAESLAEDCARAGAAAGLADWMCWYTAQLYSIRWFQGRVGELADTVATIVNSPSVSVADHSLAAFGAVASAAAGQRRQARGALARLVGRDLADLPVSASWLVTIACVIEAAALLDDSAVASRAYGLLQPFAHLPLMPGIGVSCLGSAEHPLGVACLVTGDVEQAAQHFRAAVADNCALGHWPAATLSRHLLAQALSARGAPGDAKAAADLSIESAAEAAELGIRLPPQAGRRGRLPGSAPVCRRWGRGWRIEFRGRAALVDDMVGLRHLAALIANPGVSIRAVDLTKPDLHTSISRPAPQPILDQEALHQYRARLRVLPGKIADAERRDDAGRLDLLRTEREWLLREIGSSTGLGGHSRPFADEAERARIAVHKAIRRALDRVAAADAVIGAELRTGIETGRECCYRPVGGH